MATTLTPEESEQLVAVGKKITGRSCGSCSLCCRLLDVPEANKPKHDWCPHCKPGKGCGIYEQRPEVCRTYTCLWLINLSFGDEWFPKRCGIVADIHFDEECRAPLFRFHVHQNNPNRWREEPYYSTIKKIALKGLRGEFGGSMIQTLIIQNEKRSIIVLPHKEVKYGPGITMRIGENSFEFLPMKSDEAVKKMSRELLYHNTCVNQRFNKKRPRL